MIFVNFDDEYDDEDDACTKSLDRGPFMVYSTTSLAQIFDAVPTPTCHIFVFFSSCLDTAYIFGENLSFPSKRLRYRYDNNNTVSLKGKPLQILMLRK